MLVLNSILVGVVFMLIVVSVLEKYSNRKSLNIKEEQIMSLTKMIVDQGNITSNLTKDVNNSIAVSSKMLGLINKLNTSMRNTVKNINSDMDNVLKALESFSTIQQTGVKAYNDLVDYTVDEIGKVWCDICDNDCEICPFENTCKNWNANKSSNEPYLMGECQLNKSVDPNLNCAGRMSLNLKDPKQVEKLFDKMKATGMPDAVLQKYKAVIEDAVKNSTQNSERVNIVWETQPLDRPLTQFFKNEAENKLINPNEDKLINPNSKIVKSLEKIFKESDN